MDSLSTSLKEVAGGAYSYKRDYLNSVIQLVGAEPLTATNPYSVQFKSYLLRYYLLRLAGPIIESTDSPVFEVKYIPDYQSWKASSETFLHLKDVDGVPVSAESISISLNLLRQALTVSKPYVFDIGFRGELETFITELGMLQATITNGSISDSSKGLVGLIGKHSGLIQTLVAESRTAGFGSAILVIQKHLSGNQSLGFR